MANRFQLGSHDFAQIGSTLGLSGPYVHRLFSTGQLSRFKVAELKSIIRYLNSYGQRRVATHGPRLPVSGRKDDLIQRIVDNITVPAYVSRSINAGVNAAPPPHGREVHVAPPRSSSASASAARSSASSRASSHGPRVLVGIGGSEVLSSSSRGDSRGGQRPDTSIMDVYSKYASKPGFKDGLDPFVEVRGVRACEHVNLSSSYAHRVVFTLPRAGFEQVQTGQRLLQLRAYDPVADKHVRLSSSFSLSINGNYVSLSNTKERKGRSKLAHEVVKPIELRPNTLRLRNELEIRLNTYLPHERWAGLIWVEYVRKRDISEVIQLTQQTSAKRNATAAPGGSTASSNGVTAAAASAASNAAPAPAPPAVPQLCAVCGKTERLQRCSRCKSVLYCSTAHQYQDWPKHRAVCKPPEQQQQQQQQQQVQAQAQPQHPQHASPVVAPQPRPHQEIMVQAEQLVKLTCPLSLERIEHPARGVNCKHRQCFDLTTYLELSKLSGLYQCPICQQGLPFPQVIIDASMEHILNETKSQADAVDEVLLLGDGSYKVVTAADRERRAREAQARKRKRMEARRASSQRPTQRPRTDVVNLNGSASSVTSDGAAWNSSPSPSPGPGPGPGPGPSPSQSAPPPQQQQGGGDAPIIILDDD